MSLERSSHLPGGFQIRHCTLGIYQGSAIELAFWHPASGMPEYGLCRLSFLLQPDRLKLLNFFSGEGELFGLEVFFHVLWVCSSGQREHPDVHGKPKDDLRDTNS